MRKFDGPLLSTSTAQTAFLAYFKATTASEETSLKDDQPE
jgi:hypothetical protein